MWLCVNSLRYSAAPPTGARLCRRDRLFWLGLSRLWQGWKSVLVIVTPATVIRWQRQGFRYYWRWKSRGRPVGRPLVEAEVRALIRRLSHENPIWGTPRFQAELRLLGHDVAASTIDKYRARGGKPASPTWRSFLKNHVAALTSVDFLVVPTVTFQLLYVFVVLRHERRKVVHFNVTAHPTAAWTGQQVRQAFPFDEAPRYLLRDRDAIYGEEFQRGVRSLGIQEVIIAPRSPWQSPYVERLIGTLRRECLDHVIVLNEAHLRRTLSSFLNYYHNSRPHQALEANAPCPRAVEPPELGKVTSISQVGGLHHRYTRTRVA